MSLLPEDMQKGSGGVTPPTPPKPPAPPSSSAAPSVPRAVPPTPPKPPAPPLAPPPAPVTPPAPVPSFGGLGGGLRVSLMPSELEGKPAPDLRRRVLILALVLVVETALIGVAFLLILRASGGMAEEGTALAARRAEAAAEVQRKETLVREAVTWNKQKIAAAAALDSHIRWTSFFDLLESVTLPSVSYLSFSGDADAGTVTIDAAANGYRDVAEQIVLLRAHPAISDVRTSSASARVDETGEIVGVAFSMVLRVDPSVWRSMK